MQIHRSRIKGKKKNILLRGSLNPKVKSHGKHSMGLALYTPGTCWWPTRLFTGLFLSKHVFPYIGVVEKGLNMCGVLHGVSGEEWHHSLIPSSVHTSEASTGGSPSEWDILCLPTLG